MKKLLFFGSAAAMLALSACSADEPINGGIADGTPVDVTFSTVLPNSLATRAYGDGTTAKELYYAVYDKDGNYLFDEQTEFPANSLHKDVSIQLVTGETYQLVFWAQNASAPYTFDAAAKTMTANYPTENNAETLDAFYVTKTITVAADDLNQEAELTRPFCQVNIATGDKAIVEKTGVTFPTESSVTFANVPNVLNLLDGTVDGAAEVTFSQATLPTGTITVAEKVYDYLSMTYFLAPSEGDVQSAVTMKVNNLTDGTRSYNNIPVKRNYKTNIVGDLLTSTTMWDVYINPIFETPDYDVNVWGGETVAPEVDEAAKSVAINSAAQLAGFAAKVNAGTNYQGYTVTLNCDIDLNGMEWTPIGLNSDSNKKFLGTFDGNGYTISNLKVNQQTAVYQSAGLFGSINGTVKNLTVENADIYLNSAGSGSDNGAGVISGAIYPGGLIENCVVKNSNVNSNRYVGAITGYSYGNVKNCKVYNSTFTATVGSILDNDKVGGIVGYVGEGNNVVSGNTVEGCTMFGQRNIGGIAGCTNEGCTVSDNNVLNSFIYYKSGTTNSDSGSYSNGLVCGRPINSTVENNVTTGSVIEKKTSLD